MQNFSLQEELIMDMIKKYFPVSTRANDITGLIISIIIYLLAPVVLGIVSSLLSGIPVIGWLIGIVMTLIDIYCFVGIVLAVLIFLKKIN